MAKCVICGKEYGMFGGGSEPFTGNGLIVCNNCGNVLKEIDKAKNDINECKMLADKLISLCESENVINIISNYLEKISGESEISQQMEEIERKFKESLKNFKLTTGYNFEGYKVSEYKGIVSGEVVVGTGFISEFSASFSDLFGTQSKTFADKMTTVKQGAQNNLIKNAMLKGANALIGVDFDYITFSNNILGVSANGTAVVIEKE